MVVPVVVPLFTPDRLIHLELTVCKAGNVGWEYMPEL